MARSHAAVGGTLVLDKNAYTISESAGFLNVSVTLSGAAPSGQTVNYRTQANTAVPGGDYGTHGDSTEVSGTLTFDNADEPQQILSIPIIPNGVLDGTRTFNVIIENPGGGATLGSPSNAVVSIADDDAAFQFTADTYPVNETAGTTSVILVQRLGPVIDTAFVQYVVSDGSGVSGVAYNPVVPNPGTLTFGPGVYTQSIPLTLVDNKATQGERTVLLWLMNNITSTVPIRDTAVVIIKDTDAVPADLGFDSTSSSFQEDCGFAEVYVHRMKNMEGRVTIDYATADYVGTHGVDYVETSGTLTFEAGQEFAKIDVQIIPDYLPNGHKEIWVILSNPSPGTTMGFGPRTRIVIWDKENSIEFLGPWAYLQEGNCGNTTILRGGASRSEALVTVATVNQTAPPPYGSAVGWWDYQPVQATLDFLPGVSHLTLPNCIVTWDDYLAEGSELIHLKLSNLVNLGGGNYVFGRSSEMDFVLYDNSKPGDVALSATDYAVTEGGDAVISAQWSNGAATYGPTVPYQVLSGTAQSGTDFSVTSGTLSFSPANLVQSFTVHTIPDGAVNGPKTATIVLSPGSGVQLNVPSTATLHILDADGQTLQLGAPTYQVVRSAGTVTVTGTRAGSTTGAVTVNYAVTLDPASVNKGFTPLSGTTTFAAGQASVSYTVAFPNDGANRGPLILDVTLSSPTGGAQLGWPASAVVTIVDDNPVSQVQFGSRFFSEIENSQAVITVTRTNPTGGGMTVDYATVGGTAILGTDYQSTSGTLTFGAGEASKTFTVTLLKSDGASEFNEYVDLALTNPGGGAQLGGPLHAWLMLVDNSLMSTGPREPVVWAAASGVTVAGNNLTKVAGTQWANAGAVSTRALASGDGYVEVQGSEVTTGRILGLSHGDTDTNYTDIDFGLYLAGGTLMVYEGGTPRGSFGPFGTGDMLRVAVVGGVVQYSRNAKVFYTSTLTPTYPLLVDTSLLDYGATLKGVVLSGNLITVAPSSPSPTPTPSPGATGEPVMWTALSGVAASGNNGNNLTKTAVSGWGNAGAVSTQAITAGDGYVELVASETTTARMVGLSNGDTNQNYTDIDFAAYLNTNTLMVYEGGVSRGSFGTFATGDVIRVAVVSGVVRYSKNGSVFYSSSVTPTYPLLVDTAFLDQGGTIRSVVIAGTLINGASPTPTPTATPTPTPTPTPAPVTIEAVVWTAASGVAVSGNNLTKTAASAWGNAGAVSTLAIASGDGYVEFVASETTTARMVGLSNGDTNTTYADVDFGIYLFGGTVLVYESGYSRGSFGAYGTNDVLRVLVAGGVVSYSRNGIVFYTSSRTPTYPLLVDTALLDTGATIQSVVISGSLAASFPPTPTPIPTPTPAPTPTPGPVTTETVAWTSASGVAVSGSNLTKTAASGWGNAGAVSTRALGPGDGYVELVASETTTARMLGLSNGDTNLSYTDIDYAAYLNVGTLLVYEGGVSRGSFGSFANGDVIRVAVVSGVVKYSKNGAVFYTSTLTPTYPLLVDSALLDHGATIQSVVISGSLTDSFPPTPTPTPSPTPTPTPTPGPGTTENVAWTAASGVAVSGSNLTKTAASGWGNAGAVSTRAIASGDGYVEFVASETTRARMVGLSNGDTNQSYTDIDFAVYLNTNSLMVYEAGVSRGSFGTFATGDLIRVAVVGGAVRYSKNGTVFYYGTVTPTYPLLVDSALLDQGATIQSVVISGTLTSSGYPETPTPSPTPTPTPAPTPTPWPTENVAWTAASGVWASGNNLTKTAASGWGNAGAVSTRAIASGDGYVEFVASETTTARMVGLSNGDTNQSYSDIDFAVYLNANTVMVYEGGVQRGSFGTFANGDVIRVAVTGGVVTYSKNGTVFYNSTLTPAYPLLVDTALLDSGATIKSVVISGGSLI